jgi:hypothetical protein
VDGRSWWPQRSCWWRHSHWSRDCGCSRGQDTRLANGYCHRARDRRERGGRRLNRGEDGGRLSGITHRDGLNGANGRLGHDLGRGRLGRGRLSQRSLSRSDLSRSDLSRSDLSRSDLRRSGLNRALRRLRGNGLGSNDRCGRFSGLDGSGGRRLVTSARGTVRSREAQTRRGSQLTLFPPGRRSTHAQPARANRYLHLI